MPAAAVIDLDRIFDLVSPPPPKITIDSTTYQLRRVTVAEAAAINAPPNYVTHLPELVALLRPLFKGAAPKALDECLDPSASDELREAARTAVTLILVAVQEAEVAPQSIAKKLQA